MLPGKLILKKSIAEMVLLAGFLPLTEGGFRVLNYHSITQKPVEKEFYQMTTPAALFKMQMSYLHSNGYNVITCLEAAENIRRGLLFPPKAVCITFDDGFGDNLACAQPVLESHGFKATVFVTVGYIGSSPSWLGWEDIKEMSKRGTFSIGSHCMTHRKLRGLKDSEQRTEIGSSKRILEDWISGPVELFAYPFGSYDSFDTDSIGVLKAHGYKAAFTTIAGLNDGRCDPYTIKRTRISWFNDRPEFAKELKGAYDWYRIWQRITAKA